MVGENRRGSNVWAVIDREVTRFLDAVDSYPIVPRGSAHAVPCAALASKVVKERVDCHHVLSPIRSLRTIRGLVGVVAERRE